MPTVFSNAKSFQYEPENHLVLSTRFKELFRHIGRLIGKLGELFVISSQFWRRLDGSLNIGFRKLLSTGCKMTLAQSESAYNITRLSLKLMGVVFRWQRVNYKAGSSSRRKGLRSLIQQKGDVISGYRCNFNIIWTSQPSRFICIMVQYVR